MAVADHIHDIACHVAPHDAVKIDVVGPLTNLRFQSVDNAVSKENPQRPVKHQRTFRRTQIGILDDDIARARCSV